MGIIKKIKIKNRTYYFYDDMFDIMDCDSGLLKLDKNSFKSILFITFDTLQKKINTKLIVYFHFI